jgi:hypothetical protein
MLNSGKNISNNIEKLKGRLIKAFPFFVAILFLLPGYTSAQIHEVGVGLGGANYVGDLIPTYTYENYRLAGEAFYRYNLSESVTLRGNLWLGRLVGSENTDYDGFNAARNRTQEFKVLAAEIGALFEYNFFNYRDESGLIRWTPYFVGGIGGLYFQGYNAYVEGSSAKSNYSSGNKTANFSSFQPVIPVGLGVKYAITPQWAVGAEWVARKTFTDYLDNTGALENPQDYAANPSQYGNSKHKDWYFFTGLTLSYTIWTIPCPFDYE